MSTGLLLGLSRRSLDAVRLVNFCDVDAGRVEMDQTDARLDDGHWSAEDGHDLPETDAKERHCKHKGRYSLKLTL